MAQRDSAIGHMVETLSIIAAVAMAGGTCALVLLHVLPTVSARGGY